MKGDPQASVNGSPAAKPTEVRVGFDFMKGRCQLGSACQYSHRVVDCLRKGDENLVSALSSPYISERAKRVIDWNKFEELKRELGLKEEVHRSTGSLRVLSEEDGNMIEDKYSEVVETPSQTNSSVHLPSSIYSRHVKLQEEQQRELSEEDN